MSKRSRELWKHNSFFGHARMMEAQCQVIIDAESTDPSTKLIAREIRRLARELSLALKNRIDQ